MLREADAWAKLTFEHKKKHRVPNRLFLPDPWQFLLDAPSVPPAVKNVCRAAQSQLCAWRRIAHMKAGLATLNADLYETAVKAKAQGNKTEYTRAIAKYARWITPYAPVQNYVRAAADREAVCQMERVLKHRRAQLVHRGQGEDTRQPWLWPTWADFARSNKLIVKLVEWWVSSPKIVERRPPAGGKPVHLPQQAIPGLMFFRNEALTEFLKFALGQVNLTPAVVKKVRQRLGLVPVRDCKPLVWHVSVTRRDDGDWNIKLAGTGTNKMWIVMPKRQQPAACQPYH